jgi:hypothetical protein
MLAIGLLFVRMLCDCFKPRPRLEAEILILRHQLNVLQQRAPRRRLHLRWIDRAPRTHPARGRSSGSETLLRSRSLADYTIDVHESEFSGPQGVRQAK